MNVKAGITTTAAKAAREGFEGAYSDAHAGEDTRSNIVRAKGGFTTTEAAAAREGFAAAYGNEWEGISLCGSQRSHRAFFHAIDARSARLPGGVVLSPLDRASTAARSLTHYLIFTQAATASTTCRSGR